MSTTTTSLQQIINNKAIARLEKDLLDFSNLISQHIVFQKGASFPDLLCPKEKTDLKIINTKNEVSQNVSAYAISDFKKENIISLLDVSRYYSHSDIDVSGLYARYMYDALLPIYIQEETQSFVAKVDSLQLQINQLKEDVEEQNF